MTTHAHLLDKYAELTVKSGLNVRKGQQVLITAPLEAVDLVRLITHHAYKVGASLVTTLYSDEKTSLMRYADGDKEAFVSNEGQRGCAASARAEGPTGCDGGGR